MRLSLELLNNIHVLTETGYVSGINIRYSNDDSYPYKVTFNWSSLKALPELPLTKIESCDYLVSIETIRYTLGMML